MTVRPGESALGLRAFVPLNTYNVEVLQSAKYTQEVLAGTNSDLVQPMALDTLPQGGNNLLFNGGFENWDWGYSPDNTSVINSTHGPLGWRILGGQSTQMGSAESGQGYMCQFTSHGVAGAAIFQSIYNAQEFRGRQVTFRIRTTGGRVTLGLSDDTGANGGSVQVDSTDQIWRTMSCTYTVGALANTVQATVYTDINQTVYLESASVAPFPGPIAYQPRQMAWDRMEGQQRVAFYYMSVRWRPLVANDRVQLYLPFRGAPVPAAIVPFNDAFGNDIVLNFPGNPPTTDANMDLGNCGVLDADANGANVQFASIAANTNTYMYNAWVSVFSRNG